mmetsp:Transcript_39597/g.113529  ORF Transcript_39597/g.113529 Transcript_39597/m.113529 type:complete len:147 (+) Transcript_39597:83-523(+)
MSVGDVGAGAGTSGQGSRPVGVAGVAGLAANGQPLVARSAGDIQSAGSAWTSLPQVLIDIETQDASLGVWPRLKLRFEESGAGSDGAQTEVVEYIEIAAEAVPYSPLGTSGGRSTSAGSTFGAESTSSWCDGGSDGTPPCCRSLDR